MTPEQLVTVILGSVGVALQIAFMYLPKFKDWYQNHPQKGLVALAFNVGFGAVYFAFACVPFLADLLKIGLTCDVSGAWVFVQAVFLMLTSQQLTYLVLKPVVKNKFG